MKTIETMERVVGDVLRGAGVRPSVVTLRPAARTITIDLASETARAQVETALRRAGLWVCAPHGLSVTVRT